MDKSDDDSVSMMCSLPPSGDHIHVDLTSAWISGRRLCGNLKTGQLIAIERKIETEEGGKEREREV